MKYKQLEQKSTLPIFHQAIELLEKLNPKEFRDKFNVPIYVGEFAIEVKVAGNEYQQQTIADRIQAFEELGYHWTYWNYRETTDPSTMALHPHKMNGEEYPVNATLLKALQTGWDLNQPIKK